MAKKKLRFDFPTDEKQALELLRLQADLRDLADGSDDVDESAALTRSYLEEIWQAGQVPTVQELADVAAGHDDWTSYAPADGDGDRSSGSAAARDDVDWQDIARALRAAEKEHALDGRTITGALAGLGFERETRLEKKAGALVFGKGKRFVGVRVFQLGNIRMAEIAVARRKKDKRDDDNDFGELEKGTAGAYVAGTLMAPHYWSEIVDGFLSTLEVARTALEKVGGGKGRPDLPVEFAALKALIKEGKDEEEQLEDARELAEIGEKQARIQALWLRKLQAGKGPLGVVLQFDGPDGAGKSSSSKYIPAALLAVNDALPTEKHWSVRIEIFKAPTDEDKAWMAADVGAALGLPKWLARHVKRGLAGEREILIKDRYQPGDYVYVGEQTAARLEQMAEENGRYEALLAEKGILVFRAILWADKEKQAKTIGKRMARGSFVDALIGELRDRGDLDAASENALTEVKQKVQNTDLVGMSRFAKVLPLFQEWAAATNTPVIDATDRHAARLELLELFHGALEDFQA